MSIHELIPIKANMTCRIRRDGITTYRVWLDGNNIDRFETTDKDKAIAAFVKLAAIVEKRASSGK
jgi:hypothetical protein